MIALMIGMVACSDLLSNPALPDGVQSPDMYNNRVGAYRLAFVATEKFRTIIRDNIVESGLVTDELSNRETSIADLSTILDSRTFSSIETETRGAGTGTYRAFHDVRAQARLARGALARYATDADPSILVRLYMYEAYAEILLADMYCSGVPLSTMDFGGDYTYRPSSTTTEVYMHAIKLLDSASTLSSDSLSLNRAIQVLKGRALVMIGKYQEAKSAVTEVLTADVYRVNIAFRDKAVGNRAGNLLAMRATVSDREGVNGLAYLSSRDPRSAADTFTIEVSGSTRQMVNYPNKYRSLDTTTFVVANGIEARLIEAEAALAADDPNTWLTILNTLRTPGTYSTIDTVWQGDTVVRVDTAWNAGTGGVNGLGPLKDPGSRNGRLDRLFAERAAWLFVTGHRQGDLRRLVTRYGRDRETVYPTGAYTNPGGFTVYGTDIMLPIPGQESPNPNFHGCLDHE